MTCFDEGNMGRNNTGQCLDRVSRPGPNLLGLRPRPTGDVPDGENAESMCH